MDWFKNEITEVDDFWHIVAVKYRIEKFKLLVNFNNDVCGNSECVLIEMVWTLYEGRVLKLVKSGFLLVSHTSCIVLESSSQV